MTSELLAFPVKSLADPLDEVARAHLCEVLPGHVASRRWFRAKTRTIQKIDVEDVLPLPGTHAHFLILKIYYVDGDHDRYILPVSVESSNSGEREEVVARLLSADSTEGVLYSALGDEVFRKALLGAIVCEQRFEGSGGQMSALRTSALQHECGPSLPELESFVSGAEQSNTSVIYRDRYILKLFRKLEPGTNPDLEMGKFLTEHRFRNTPAVLGSLEYQPRGSAENFAVGILQEFVPNRGDAWKYTLEALADFFSKALASHRDPPPRKSEHPLDLIGAEIPSEVRTFIGPYLEAAALLGKRTAEMHAALANPQSGPDFAPEAFTAQDSQKLHRDLTGQADIAFGLLRRHQGALNGATAERARELLSLESRVADRFKAIESHPVTAERIRHHGDYHLGQVLYTGHDFMIIDFEGEPARPLAERRLKALAVRDVAGMVRSFQYAAFAVLFGQVPGVPTEPDALGRIENWAAAWNAYVSATYLQAYFEGAQDTFIPAGWTERRVLLDAFLLQKALYEVAYELNNRPDWLQIPLRGIIGLMG